MSGQHPLQKAGLFNTEQEADYSTEGSEDEPRQPAMNYCPNCQAWKEKKFFLKFPKTYACETCIDKDQGLKNKDFE